MGPELLIASMVTGAIGSGVSAVSQANAASFNAKAASQNRELALQQARLEEKRFRKQARFAQGRARTQAQFMEGSALDILEDNAINQEFDAQLIRTQGALHARNFEIERRLNKSRGRSALVSAPFSMASALLGPLSTGAALGVFNQESQA